MQTTLHRHSLSLVLAGACVATGLAWAGTITVQGTNDTGVGSLREAIVAANSDPGSVIDMTGLSGTISLASALPAITADTTINGPGSDQLTVRRADGAAQEFRVLSVDAGADVEINGLTVSHGVAPYGGGIRNEGTLTLDDVVVRDNEARDEAPTRGGGIHNIGTLTLTSSTVRDNRANAPKGANGTGASSRAQGQDGADAYGGGIYNSTGTVVIDDSTVSGNQANAGPGGDDFYASGHGGNGGDAMGGGVYSLGGSLTLTHSTITANVLNRSYPGVGNPGGGGSAMPTTRPRTEPTARPWVRGSRTAAPSPCPSRPSRGIWPTAPAAWAPAGSLREEDSTTSTAPVAGSHVRCCGATRPWEDTAKT